MGNMIAELRQAYLEDTTTVTKYKDKENKKDPYTEVQFKEKTRYTDDQPLWLKDFQFIKLRGDTKIPLHSFKNKEDRFSWDEVKDFPDLAVCIPDGYTVVDIDDMTEAINTLLALSMTYDTSTLPTVITRRGFHVWFKAPAYEVKNTAGTMTPLSVLADYRDYRTTGYTVIKENGKWRRWLEGIDNNMLELPDILKPLGSYNKNKGDDGFTRMSFVDSERNNTLFKYSSFLARNVKDIETRRDLMYLINEFILPEPLDASEIERIARPEQLEKESSYTVEEEEEGTDGKPKKPRQSITYMILQKLLENYSFKRYNERIYIYDAYSKKYSADDYIINTAIHDMFQTFNPKTLLSSRSRQEIYDALYYNREIETITVDINDKTQTRVEDNLVLLQNGILNLNTRELLPHGPEYFLVNKMGVSYNPEANEKLVMDTLRNWVEEPDRDNEKLYEQKVTQLLEIGALGISRKSPSYRKMYILIGGGQNGKSTYLDQLKNLLGNENVSELEINDFSKPYRTSVLEGKVANIGSEIEDRHLSHLSILKSIVSGEAIMIEQKFKDARSAYITPLLVYATNNMPAFSDKSEGMTSRLITIPFKQQYKPEDADKTLTQRLNTPEALSTLLNHVLDAYDTLMERGYLLETLDSEKLKRQVKIDNDSVLLWYTELIEEHGDAYLSDIRVDKAYTYLYLPWARNSGIKPRSKYKFGENIAAFSEGKYCIRRALRHAQPVHISTQDAVLNLRDGGTVVDMYAGQANRFIYLHEADTVITELTEHIDI